jgi:hypothetical protein
VGKKGGRGGGHQNHASDPPLPLLLPCRFFITTSITAWLDGRHVVFGEVVEGYDTVVKQIEAVGSPSGTPAKKVVIVNSGELK